MMKTTLLCFFLALWTGLSGQLNVHWNFRYQELNEQNESPAGLCVDQMENVYLAVTSLGLGTNYEQLTLIKLDAQGNLLWTVKDTSIFKVEDMVVDDNQNVYVLGAGYMGGLVETRLISFDVNGQERWRDDQVLSGDSREGFLEFSPDGLHVAAQRALNVGNQAISIAQYDLNGNQNWAWPFLLGGTNFIHDMTTDPLGYTYLTGLTQYAVDTQNGALTDGNLFAAKYGTDSIPDWFVEFDGGVMSPMSGRDIQVSDSGDVYVQTDSRVQTVQEEARVYKLSGDSGNVEWIVQRGFMSTVNAPQGGLLVDDDAVYTMAHKPFSALGYSLRSLNFQGQENWDYQGPSFGSPWVIDAQGMDFLPNGDIVVFGNDSYHYPQFSPFVKVFSPQGLPIDSLAFWEFNVQEERVKFMAIAPSGDIYVVMATLPTLGNPEPRLVKISSTPLSVYSEDDGIIEASLFPHPITSWSTLRFSQPLGKGGHLTIANELGQVLLAQEMRGIEFELSREKFQPGVYFFKVQSGNGQIGNGKFLVY